jgi:hypothetical protein
LNVLIHVHRHPGVALRTPLPTTPTTPVNTLTDKEALDQVQKTPLNIFGIMQNEFKIGKRTLSYK